MSVRYGIATLVLMGSELMEKEGYLWRNGFKQRRDLCGREYIDETVRRTVQKQSSSGFLQWKPRAEESFLMVVSYDAYLCPGGVFRIR